MEVTKNNNNNFVSDGAGYPSTMDTYHRSTKIYSGSEIRKEGPPTSNINGGNNRFLIGSRGSLSERGSIGNKNHQAGGLMRNPLEQLTNRQRSNSMEPKVKMENPRYSGVTIRHTGSVNGPMSLGSFSEQPQPPLLQTPVKSNITQTASLNKSNDGDKPTLIPTSTKAPPTPMVIIPVVSRLHTFENSSSTDSDTDTNIQQIRPLKFQPQPTTTAYDEDVSAEDDQHGEADDYFPADATTMNHHEYGYGTHDQSLDISAILNDSSMPSSYNNNTTNDRPSIRRNSSNIYTSKSKTHTSTHSNTNNNNNPNTSKLNQSNLLHTSALNSSIFTAHRAYLDRSIDVPAEVSVLQERRFLSPSMLATDGQHTKKLQQLKQKGLHIEYENDEDKGEGQHGVMAGVINMNNTSNNILLNDTLFKDDLLVGMDEKGVNLSSSNNINNAEMGTQTTPKPHAFSSSPLSSTLVEQQKGVRNFFSSEKEIGTSPLRFEDVELPQKKVLVIDGTHMEESTVNSPPNTVSLKPSLPPQRQDDEKDSMKNALKQKFRAQLKESLSLLDASNISLKGERDLERSYNTSFSLPLSQAEADYKRKMREIEIRSKELELDVLNANLVSGQYLKAKETEAMNARVNAEHAEMTRKRENELHQREVDLLQAQLQSSMTHQRHMMDLIERANTQNQMMMANLNQTHIGTVALNHSSLYTNNNSLLSHNEARSTTSNQPFSLTPSLTGRRAIPLAPPHNNRAAAKNYTKVLRETQQNPQNVFHTHSNGGSVIAVDQSYMMSDGRFPSSNKNGKTYDLNNTTMNTSANVSMMNNSYLSANNSHLNSSNMNNNSSVLMNNSSLNYKNVMQSRSQRFKQDGVGGPLPEVDGTNHSSFLNNHNNNNENVQFIVLHPPHKSSKLKFPKFRLFGKKKK